MTYSTTVAVIGAGVIGMSTALALKDRGVEVICIEQGTPGSGQSKGIVRNFRHYHADLNMIKYARLAHTAWKHWEDRFDRTLLKKNGLIYLSNSGQQIAEALQRCEIAVAIDTTSGPIAGLPTNRHWDLDVVVDEQSGPIWARETIDTLSGVLSDNILNATVLALDAYRGHVEVATTDGIVRAEAVVVCAGTQTDRIALSAGIVIDVACAIHSRPYYFIKDEFKSLEFKSVIDASTRYGPSIYGAPTPDGLGYVVGLNGVDEDTPVGSSSEYSINLEDINSDIGKVNGYVKEAFTWLESQPAATRLCTTTSIPGENGDAIACYKRGRLNFMIGNNLFKFAPLLGEDLANVALDTGSGWLVRPI